MSAPAAVTLRRQGAPDLLVAYADAVAALPIGPDGRRLRRNAATRLLAAHPQLAAWMRRPTPAAAGRPEANRRMAVLELVFRGRPPHARP